MLNLEPKILLYALLGGILPAILWLWFWLKEDSKKPEPRGLLTISFLAGMAGVLVVFPLEKLAYDNLSTKLLPLIISWAFIEEFIKYLSLYYVDLKSRYFDEPVDALIYIITIALGFAALENVLFIIKPLQSGEVITGLLTGHFRFMGATLLHIVASGSMGIAIGLSFYKSRFIKRLYTFVGIIVAVLLHTLFNFFIIKSDGQLTFTILSVLWIAVVILFLFFEKIKRIKNPIT